MSRVSIALVAGLLLACAAYAADSAHTAEGVRAAEQARADALLKADTTALSRLVADDFVEISRLGTLRTKADNIKDIASGDLKLLTVKYDSTNVRVYGDVAVLRAIANNTGMFHGQPFAGRIWYTRVFVWKDGRWQAVTMQQTPIAG
ncbi:MAG TPA: nuclear transport factor 2 family protein [Candidatus Eisenbacteria bacterium]|nr:nuclear transport factor 2 family protein [Candidatus Eisenbacteria bacterium]